MQSAVTPVSAGAVSFGTGPSARLHPRAVRDRERGARHRDRASRSPRSPRASACRSSSRRRSTRPIARRSRRFAARVSTTACACSAKVKARTGLPILTDIHEAAQAAPAARGRRHPADSGVPVPADRPARRRGEDRPRGQRQEGPVPRAEGHAARGRQAHRVAATRSVLVTERGVVVRLQQPGRRHARVADAARARLPRGLRRDPQPAAARRRRRRDRRAWPSTSSRWRRPAWPPAWTACSWRCTRNPAAAKSDAANALRLDRLEPLLRRLVALDRIVGACLTCRSPARSCRPKRPRSSRWSTASTSASRKRSTLIRDCKGRVIVTGMGKSGIICRKIAATLVEHRHAGVLPASRRGRARRPRRHPGGRRRDRAVVQRRDRGADARARDAEAARHAADRDHRRRRRRRWRRPPTSRSTAACPKKPAR